MIVTICFNKLHLPFQPSFTSILTGIHFKIVLFCFPLQNLCIKIQEINIGSTAREATSALLQVTYQVGLCIPQGLEQVFVGQVLGWSEAESSLILLGLVVSAQGSSVSTLPNRASSISSMSVTLAMSACLRWHIKCAGLAAI